jgi:hypothetical protein
VPPDTLAGGSPRRSPTDGRDTYRFTEGGRYGRRSRRRRCHRTRRTRHYPRRGSGPSSPRSQRRRSRPATPASRPPDSEGDADVVGASPVVGSPPAGLPVASDRGGVRTGSTRRVRYGRTSTGRRQSADAGHLAGGFASGRPGSDRTVSRRRRRGWMDRARTVPSITYRRDRIRTKGQVTTRRGPPARRVVGRHGVVGHARVDGTESVGAAVHRSLGHHAPAHRYVVEVDERSVGVRQPEPAPDRTRPRDRDALRIGGRRNTTWRSAEGPSGESRPGPAPEATRSATGEGPSRGSNASVHTRGRRRRRPGRTGRSGRVTPAAGCRRPSSPGRRSPRPRRR